MISEFREKTLPLKIELVPSSSWFNNVRSAVDTHEWDRIRKMTYMRSNYRCDICQGQGDTHPVECHEIWEYDDRTRVQKLKALTSLCPKCHRVKHLGFQMVLTTSRKNTQQPNPIDYFGDAVLHFMQVNHINEVEADYLIEKAFRKHALRSQKEWDVDIYHLQEYGIDVEKKIMGKKDEIQKVQKKTSD